MAKVHDQSNETHQCCKVWGFYRQADGAPMKEPITITPGQPGVWQNTLYDATPIIVSPDESGRYVVMLPPSSVLGDYVITAGRQQLTVRVPEGVASAALTALLVQE